MALLKSHSTRFGLACEAAYHRISRINAYREKFADADGLPGVRFVAEVTTEIFVDAAAAANPAIEPVDQSFTRAVVDPVSAYSTIVAAYMILKATPEYADAVDA